jgi:hypothetical protein
VYPIYLSDLTDAEWALLAGFVPAAKPGGRPRSVSMRRIGNGLFYLLRTGSAWRYPLICTKGLQSADVFALGVLMHHLLTKQDPRLRFPYSFHTHPMRQYNPAVSPERDAVVMKCLQQPIVKRFQTIAELRGALVPRISIARSHGPKTGESVPANCTHEPRYVQNSRHMMLQDREGSTSTPAEIKRLQAKTRFSAEVPQLRNTCFCKTSRSTWKSLKVEQMKDRMITCVADAYGPVMRHLPRRM